jgi:hypothetical protein
LAAKFDSNIISLSFFVVVPNEANTQWIYVNNTLRLRAFSDLCMTGLSFEQQHEFLKSGATNAPVTIQTCQADNAAQQFQFFNMTIGYPYAFLSQGSFVIGALNQVWEYAVFDNDNSESCHVVAYNRQFL